MSRSRFPGLPTYALYGMTAAMLISCILPIWKVCYVGSWEIVVTSGMLWEVVVTSPDFIQLAVHSSDPSYFLKLYRPNLIGALIVLATGGILGMTAWFLRPGVSQHQHEL